MSAYGAIKVKPLDADLPTYSYPLPNGEILTTHAVHNGIAPAALIAYLHEVFNGELEEGKTYPQEGPMTLDEFKNYFFGASTIIGVLSPAGTDPATVQTLEDAHAGRDWKECIGGCYYIKPNYPGRSSHNCNAGFLVPNSQRGKKIGNALAESYTKYAPALGYRGSVFNLVYENNVASLRLWEKLGFTKVGVIPGAGLLKTGNGDEEKYYDAHIIYKSWV